MPSGMRSESSRNLIVTTSIPCAIATLRSAALAGVPNQAQVGHMSAQVTAMYLHISQRAVHKAARQIEQESEG
jgi:hypothetical protein